jgi:hypothetical protein
VANTSSQIFDKKIFLPILPAMSEGKLDFSPALPPRTAEEIKTRVQGHGLELAFFLDEGKMAELRSQVIESLALIKAGTLEVGDAITELRNHLRRLLGITRNTKGRCGQVLSSRNDARRREKHVPVT